MTAKLTKTFFIILILIPALSYAQTEKGNILLGGGIDLSNTKFDNDDFNQRETFLLSLNPAISYLVVDNLALGMSIPFSYSKLAIGGNDAQKSSNVSFGPKVRYYFGFDRLAIFPQMSYSVGSGKIEMTFIDAITGGENVTTEKYSLSNFNTGLGLAYFINKNISLESILSYKIQNINYENGSYSDSEQSAINFNIGFQIYLQTKND